MRTLVSAALGTILLLVGRPGASLPAKPTVAQLLDVCSSATVAEAAVRGSRLGWERMGEARFASWRAAIEQNGLRVQAVGWARGPEEGDGLLSFFTLLGVGAQNMCSYSVGDAAGLLEGLSGALGTPSRREEGEIITSVEWAWRLGVVSFVQVGTSGLVSVTNVP